MRRSLLRSPLVPVLVLLVVLAGCAGLQETGESDEEEEGEPSQTSASAGPDLAPQSDAVRTVQFYRGSDERSLPVTSLHGEESLTLEFDLMEREGRSLSVYFVHATRDWTRDLSPSRVLESYHDDQIVEYRASQGTEVPYVHYTYRFPNDDIRFRLSGNYFLRVTERGRRDSVLFERPFFVTDEAGRLDLQAEGIRVPGQRQQSLRPVARFDPPTELQGDPFGYSVCFVRNGRLPDTRCQDRPLLGQQPRLEFELERDRAFAPATADYTIDLGNLRSSAGIERLDRTVSPFQVLLEPDYAQFSGQDREAMLNGQIVVRDAVRGRADPAFTAEYVETTFAFIPPREQPLGSTVTLAGSFSGMDPSRGVEMRWNAGRGRYEGTLLLKQGRYQYFYDTPDPELRRVVRQAQARLQNTYTTFVYYEDPSRDTDRLLRVNSFQRQ